MLFSSNRLLPANVEVDRALREPIARATDRKVELYSEFLDQPDFAGESYEQTVARYLQEKYAVRPPDVIVLVGQFALEFLLHHRAALFPSVPVVYLGVDKTVVQSLAPLPADVVGVPVEYDSLGTMQLALHWHPNARRLLVVTGTSTWDRQWESRLRDELARSEIPVPVEFVVGLPTDDLVKRLKELGDRDVVFTPGYYRDGANRAFSPRDSAALMAAASGAPIYGPYNTFIGTGVVGGRMPTWTEMGRQAAKSVTDLLEGTPVTALHLPASVPAAVQIDWRQARRWGIGKDRIPPDANIHFKEPTFWEMYRAQAIIALVVFLLQAGLIAALLIERRVSRRTATALEQTESQMTLAARAASLSTWMWVVARDKILATTRSRPEASISEVPGSQFDDVLASVHPGDRAVLDRAVREAVAKDDELDVEYRVLQPDGSVRWIAARGRNATGGGKRLIGVAADITERKMAELQAAKDRATLTHMTRVSMLGQLSASIAHQMNQPLAAILGNAEAARKMLTRDRVDLVELREICDDIVTDDNRAAEVIRRLGALYKRGDMKMEPFDLNELIGETLELLRAELLTRHVVPRTDLAPALPTIDGDRVHLQQVLLNLILNAVDAMGGIAGDDRRLTIRTESAGTDVRLYVVDNGPGIAGNDLKHIFEAFWSTKTGGMGIGLAICQAIVGAHHGRISASNNATGGATFCVSLPLGRPA